MSLQSGHTELSEVGLTEEEMGLVEAMRKRLHVLAKQAAEEKVTSCAACMLVMLQANGIRRAGRSVVQALLPHVSASVFHAPDDGIRAGFSFYRFSAHRTIGIMVDVHISHSPHAGAAPSAQSTFTAHNQTCGCAFHSQQQLNSTKQRFPTTGQVDG